MREAIDLVKEYGSSTEASRASCIPETTLRRRYQAGIKEFGKPDVKKPPTEYLQKEYELRDEIRTLRAELTAQRKETLTFENIKKYILEVSDYDINPPTWLTNVKTSGDTTGVPTLFVSDLHWGEIVNPLEIDGVNEYNLEIAHKRIKNLWERAENLLFHHMANPKYDGLVLALGGDLVSGNIHEELSNTNETPIMPVVLDLVDKLTWLINKAAERFDNIFIPCVYGNHGRTTKKFQYKEGGATSYDWLIYQILARHFKDNKKITFQIPDGPDALYKVYNTTYLLSHGNQFRGGDGLIGCLGAIIRGRHKKSTRNQSIHKPFDVLILGHFHQLMMLPHLIVNGTTKGFDEYAFGNNFTYERASQAMWITHKNHGITMQMVVYCDDNEDNTKSEWLSIQKV